MATAAAVTPIVAPFPQGLDQTQKRVRVFGTLSFEASTQFYTTGGRPFILAGVNGMPGLSNSVPLQVRIYSKKASGYVYQWINDDLWPVSTAVVAGQAITDSNGNLQVCTTAGTTKSGSEPVWNKTNGVTTADGTAVWTNNGPSTGLVKILTGAAAQSPLAELSQSAAIPAAVSGDDIAWEAEFLRG